MKLLNVTSKGDLSRKLGELMGACKTLIMLLFNDLIYKRKKNLKDNGRLCLFLQDKKTKTIYQGGEKHVY